jgi:hypothetical protein
MSEPDDITDRPPDGPRRDDFTDQPPRDDRAYEPERPIPPPKSGAGKVIAIVIISLLTVGLLACCPLVALGLLFPAIQNVRQAAARAQSQNNLRQMGLAMMACGDSTGQLPPANGPFPPGGGGKPGSFFYHLLPYLEYNNVYAMQPTPEVAIKPYIAPADKRNPGNNGTISYCTNGTAFTSSPRWPTSFINHGTANVICVMERSGMDGAHKWNNTSNVLGEPENPPPFPQFGADPSAYQEGSPHALNGTACMVLLGDGSGRSIEKSQQAAWKWACNPAAPQVNPPPDW